MTTPSHILVPIDFSPSSYAALDYAIAFAKHAGASVDLLHVWAPPLDVSTFVGRAEAPESLAAFAATPGGTHMRECLARLEREGIPARGRLEFGDPARAINRCAADEKCDLVVIGAHDAPRPSWRSMAFHVVERVVRGASCPVLAFHGARTTAVSVPKSSAHFA